MSITDKLIIPLLDNTLTFKDVSPEAGFIALYTEDINRPYLDNHVFLLYDLDNTSADAYNANKKLQSSKYLYNSYNVRIAGHAFKMYVFAIISKAIKNIKRNAFTFSDAEKMRIFAFWNFTDKDMNAFLLDPLHLLGVMFVRTVVPEEDYIPSHDALCDEKSGALL